MKNLWTENYRLSSLLTKNIVVHEFFGLKKMRNGKVKFIMKVIIFILEFMKMKKMLQLL